MVSLSQLSAQMNFQIYETDAAVSNDPDIAGISEDSREVKPGWVFVAVSGLKYNGLDFVEEARRKGAAAILSCRKIEGAKLPQIVVSQDRLRSAMAGAACIIYNRPSDKLLMAGITGTNGKTTTAYLLEAMLNKAGLAPGVMGTVNFRWPGAVKDAPNTTPDGTVLACNLAEMHKAGSKAAIMEVSSHALALGRVSGLGFEVALFTNLSRDHLDFHTDYEDYYQAKKLLFSKYLKPGAKKAAINGDDEYGARLAKELGTTALTFGFGPDNEVRGSELKLNRDGLSFRINWKNISWVQSSPLLAEVNARNVLGAAALGLTMGLEPRLIEDSLKAAKGAPGRLEKVGQNPDYLVLVDYAHSPDALAKALEGCRELKPARLLTVFGCGGDRDKGKRPIMGEIGGRMADMAILTSDNPRTENPEAILADVEAGIKPLGLNKYEEGQLSSTDWKAGCYLVICDRRKAIKEAVRLMEPGDALLIAGKGHEDYQIIGREKHHLDDREEALKSLKDFGRN